jgi:anti-sigma factor RsiW
MDGVIRLHNDPHRNIEGLLPWYANGQLGEGERAEVEAHLSGCSECRSELATERRLAAEVAGLALDAEAGWERLRERVDASPRGAAFERPGRWYHAFGGPRNLGLFAVAQAALLALAILSLPPRLSEAPYHTLGAAAPAPSGNVIVLFRPDAREQDLRAALGAANARLVGGPTPAGAYVLHVAPAQRTAALASLRARREIVLAQPVDPGPRP